MGDAVPVKDLLLLLRPDCVVVVEVLEEVRAGLLQDRLLSGSQVPQVREDALLEFFWTGDGDALAPEAVLDDPDNVRPGDQKVAVPVDARDKLAVVQGVLADVSVVGGGHHVRGVVQKVLQPGNLFIGIVGKGVLGRWSSSGRWLLLLLLLLVCLPGRLKGTNAGSIESGTNVAVDDRHCIDSRQSSRTESELG